jgi:hypothetical protein
MLAAAAAEAMVVADVVVRSDPLLQLHDLEAAVFHLHVLAGIDWLLSFA